MRYYFKGSQGHAFQWDTDTLTLSRADVLRITIIVTHDLKPTVVVDLCTCRLNKLKFVFQIKRARSCMMPLLQNRIGLGFMSSFFKLGLSYSGVAAYASLKLLLFFFRGKKVR